MLSLSGCLICLISHKYLSAAKAKEVYQTGWKAINVNRLMQILGMAMACVSVTLICSCYIEHYKIQFVFLVIQSLLVFGINVLVFFVFTKFTPAFKMKSVHVSNNSVEIIGVNTLGGEIFKYQILEISEDDDLKQSPSLNARLNDYEDNDSQIDIGDIDTHSQLNFVSTATFD